MFDPYDQSPMILAHRKKWLSGQVRLSEKKLNPCFIIEVNIFFRESNFSNEIGRELNLLCSRVLVINSDSSFGLNKFKPYRFK